MAGAHEDGPDMERLAAPLVEPWSADAFVQAFPKPLQRLSMFDLPPVASDDEEDGKEEEEEADRADDLPSEREGAEVRGEGQDADDNRLSSELQQHRPPERGLSPVNDEVDGAGEEQHQRAHSPVLEDDMEMADDSSLHDTLLRDADKLLLGSGAVGSLLEPSDQTQHAWLSASLVTSMATETGGSGSSVGLGMAADNPWVSCMAVLQRLSPRVDHDLVTPHAVPPASALSASSSSASSASATATSPGPTPAVGPVSAAPSTTTLSEAPPAPPTTTSAVPAAQAASAPPAPPEEAPVPLAPAAPAAEAVSSAASSSSSSQQQQALLTASRRSHPPVAAPPAPALAKSSVTVTPPSPAPHPPASPMSPASPPASSVDAPPGLSSPNGEPGSSSSKKRPHHSTSVCSFSADDDPALLEAHWVSMAQALKAGKGKGRPRRIQALVDCVLQNSPLHLNHVGVQRAALQVVTSLPPVLASQVWGEKDRRGPAMGLALTFLGSSLARRHQEDAELSMGVLADLVSANKNHRAFHSRFPDHVRHLVGALVTYPDTYAIVHGAARVLSFTLCTAASVAAFEAEPGGVEQLVHLMDQFKAGYTASGKAGDALLAAISAYQGCAGWPSSTHHRWQEAGAFRVLGEVLSLQKTLPKEPAKALSAERIMQLAVAILRSLKRRAKNHEAMVSSGLAKQFVRLVASKRHPSADEKDLAKALDALSARVKAECASVERDHATTATTTRRKSSTSGGEAGGGIRVKPELRGASPSPAPQTPAAASPRPLNKAKKASPTPSPTKSVAAAPSSSRPPSAASRPSTPESEPVKKRKALPPETEAGEGSRKRKVAEEAGVEAAEGKKKRHKAASEIVADELNEDEMGCDEDEEEDVDVQDPAPFEGRKLYVLRSRLSSEDDRPSAEVSSTSDDRWVQGVVASTGLVRVARKFIGYDKGKPVWIDAVKPGCMGTKEGPGEVWVVQFQGEPPRYWQREQFSRVCWDKAPKGAVMQ